VNRAYHVAYLIQVVRARELRLKEQLAMELEHAAKVEDIFSRYEEYNEDWEEELEEKESQVAVTGNDRPYCIVINLPTRGCREK
jgi:hypothetical protein